MTSTNGTEIYKPPLAQYGFDCIGLIIITYMETILLNIENAKKKKSDMRLFQRIRWILDGNSTLSIISINRLYIKKHTKLIYEA